MEEAIYSAKSVEKAPFLTERLKKQKLVIVIN